MRSNPLVLLAVLSQLVCGCISDDAPAPHSGDPSGMCAPATVEGNGVSPELVGSVSVTVAEVHESSLTLIATDGVEYSFGWRGGPLPACLAGRQATLDSTRILDAGQEPVADTLTFDDGLQFTAWTWVGHATGWPALEVPREGVELEIERAVRVRAGDRLCETRDEDELECVTVAFNLSLLVEIDGEEVELDSWRTVALERESEVITLGGASQSYEYFMQPTGEVFCDGGGDQLGLTMVIRPASATAC